MAGVFISYKAEDRPRVQPLVDSLIRDGVDVWWDAMIAAGASWRELIEQNLEGADCVIVIWSKLSTGPEGHFVRDEATRAQRRRAYLPVRIDAVEPPLGFGEIQALSLEGWRGKENDPRYQAVLEAVRAKAGGRDADRPSPTRSPARSGLDRRLLLAGGGVAALGLAGAAFWKFWPAGTAQAASIAVLPFANMSGDPGQAYFADGLAEELRGTLSRIPGMSVIGRNSSEAVRELDVPSAAQRLKVTNILTGSVRRSPEIIRVSAQLVDGGRGIETWSDTFDSTPGDTLEIQSRIAQSVARALQLRLAPGDDALLAGGTRNAEAHDRLLRALEIGRSDSSDAGQANALSLVQAAIALDPNYAMAWALRAFIGAGLANREETIEARNRGFEEAKGYANKAIALAPSLPTALASRAAVKLALLDMTGSLEDIETAVAKGGNDPTTLGAYAFALSCFGRSDEALRAQDRSIELDPLAPDNDIGKAQVLNNVHRYAEAIAAARDSLARAPKLDGAHYFSAQAKLGLKRWQESMDDVSSFEPDNWRTLTVQAIARFHLGDKAGSDRAVARLKETQGLLASYQYAFIHAQRGEIAQGLDEIEASWESRDPGTQTIAVDFLLDPLRAEPRFKSVMEKMRV